MLFTSLETERLWLRNISPDDRAFVLRQFSDEEVCRYLFDEEPFQTLEEADALIDLFTQPEPRTQHRWILVLKDSGERVGTCGFHCWNGERAELGYDLQPAYWGRGLMSEALDAALPFAFERMGVRAVDACISVDNARSLRLAEKHGFTFLGETRTYLFRGAEYPHRILTLEKK